MTSPSSLPPNHHAHYAGCTGPLGVLAGLTMVCGRAGDARWAMQLTGAASGEHVVDIGCGPGGAVRHAARHGLRVTGIDPSGVMLGMARLLTRSDTVQLVEGTAERLPVENGSAAVIWTIASVHHWQDLDAALREIRRVLAPGGRFVAIEKHTHPGATGFASHGWTDQQAESFAGLCRDHGLGDTSVEETRAGRRNLIAVRAAAA